MPSPNHRIRVPDVFSRLRDALSDRYALDRELGEGGMATVYLAEDLRHRRKVAIKVLRPELAAVIGAERFLKEIETTASLQHPHILPLLDSGQAGEAAYYVMPFVEGESLRDRLTREKQLPVADAIRIAIEVAGALDYAHRHGVIHRDIKPENILLHDGSALVADFGIALAASKAGGTRMTETGMSLGTPHYMSPEQAMGEREISPRSDVYALGCITYEMLTGDPPFTGSTAQAIVAKVLTESPRSITAQRRTIPPEVEAAVLTALEKLPADRFNSAAEFAAALEGKGPPAGATRTRATQARRAITQSRSGLTGGLAIAALLASALALWGWLRPMPAGQVSRQKVELWNHSLGSFLAPGVERIATRAAISPDGATIIFIDSVGNSTQMFRKRHNEEEATAIAGTEGALSPFFSPDGKWVGYLSAEGRLRKVPLEGGGSVTLAESSNSGYLAGAWQDDGTIVFVGKDQGFRRVSQDGGNDQAVRVNTAQYRINVATLQPLPGSRGVLYTACPGNCGIVSSVNVYDFEADSGRVLVPNAAGAWYSPTGHLLYTDRNGGLYAAGFDPRKLILTSGVVPVLEDVAPAGFNLSRAGTALYSLKGGSTSQSELVWVSRDGKTEPFDTTWRGDFAYPALSPDGKQLAVSVRDGNTDLWVHRSDGTRQKLSQSGTVNWRPSWTADGKALVFSSNISGTNSQDAYDIYRMPVDASAPPTLLLHHSFGLWEAELSRDGQWLVVRSDEEGGLGHIRARRLSGDTTLIPILAGKTAGTQVALSPDGRWLAYVMADVFPRELYVMPFPQATSSQVISRGGGTEPRWSHSGRELFYKGTTHMMAVDIAPGPTLVAGTPRPLFPLAGYRSARNRQQYDVSPDDRRFLMIHDPTDSSPGTVVYVENWLQELQQLVKRK